MTLSDIVTKVKNSFDWTPVCVTKPVEVYCDYVDKGRVLLGYEVTVTYKHHCEHKRLFAHDEDRFCIVSRAKARKMALDFYNQMKKQINQR